ncbi:hypothetical protein [Paenibacillus faecalis]|uniref:hypothetical protein n=1 Tax=Paenibacillus faecalis TaxID=2079532 RepID=UPI000D0FE1B3|nr:hypothetical protein [Paenibacillus faecalis]
MNKKWIWLLQILALISGLAFPFIHVILRIGLLLLVYVVDAAISDDSKYNRRLMLFWIIGLIIGYIIRAFL